MKMLLNLLVMLQDKASADSQKAIWLEERAWGRRRSAFRNFYESMLRGQIEDYKERDRRWDELRLSFSDAGITLPRCAKGDKDLDRLLVIGYSIELGQGRPIGIGFETIAGLGHHVHKIWPDCLWFYRCMLRAYDQLQVVLGQDRTAKLQTKMRMVLASVAAGESDYEPNRSWDHLLIRLFPKVAPLLKQDPAQLAAFRLHKAGTGRVPRHRHHG